MKDFPDILCEESEHTTLVYASACAFGFCVVILVLICGIVYKFPAEMRRQNVDYLPYFSSLFIRTRPERYYFALCVMVRNLLMATSPMHRIFIMSVIQVVVTLIVYLAMLVRLWPWRGESINRVDAWVTVMLLLFLVVGAIQHFS